MEDPSRAEHLRTKIFVKVAMVPSPNRFTIYISETMKSWWTPFNLSSEGVRNAILVLVNAVNNFNLTLVQNSKILKIRF